MTYGKKYSEKLEKRVKKSSKLNITSSHSGVVPARNPLTNQWKGKYKIYYTNVDCLTSAKHKEMETIIETDDPDIIAITEVQAKNTSRKIEESEMNLNGYCLYHNLEKGNRGVCIYVRENLNSSESEIKPDFTESLWVEIRETTMQKVLIGCVYRSPNSTEENSKKINKFIEKLGNIKNTSLILLGDYNYPKITWNEDGGHTEDKKSDEFLNSVRDAYLIQHVLKPTRYREGQRENVLDLIFTVKEETIESLNYIPPLGKSDHCALVFSAKKTVKVEKSAKRNILNYKRANYEEMKKDIKRVIWKDEIKTVEEGWDMIKNTIHKAIHEHVPMIVVGSSKRRRPLWMNKNVLSKVKRKHAAWKRYLETKSGEDYLKYTRARNQARNVTRKAQRQFETGVAKATKENPKIFWNYINSKTKTNSKIPDIKIPGTSKKTSNDGEKVEVFNNYFKDVFTNEDTANMPSINNKAVTSVLKDIAITEEMVLKKLKAISPNKSAGPDEIPSRLIKELSEELAEPLTLLYGCSLVTGKLPKEWKTANVTPIYKKGGKSMAENYRPISLTVIICKILESIITDSIGEYMLKHKFISKHQHGFLKGKSTVTQLIETLEDWTKELEKGNNLDVLYCDFRKAFDSVPHKRLMMKVRSYGIGGDIAKWIEDFITERKQRVHINGHKSSWADVSSGVPQGSVLGPLLFVIFINDLPEAVKCGVKMYADDTKIYAVINNKGDSKKLQEEINKLFKWSVTWQLMFHPDKCHILKLGNLHEDFVYTMGTEDNKSILVETEEEKDLGIVIDNKLSFSSHYEKIVNKANKLLGIIRRNFTYIDSVNFKLMYKAIIRPTIEYGATVYNPILQQDINKIESIQRRATKMVLGLDTLTYEQRLRCLNLPTLKYRRARGDMIQVYKYMHKINIAPEGMLQIVQGSITRGHTLKLVKNRHRTNIRSHCFSQRVVNLWNSLREDTVQAQSLNGFKNRLDKEWEDKDWKFNHTYTVM